MTRMVDLCAVMAVAPPPLNLAHAHCATTEHTLLSVCVPCICVSRTIVQLLPRLDNRNQIAQWTSLAHKHPSHLRDAMPKHYHTFAIRHYPQDWVRAVARRRRRRAHGAGAASAASDAGITWWSTERRRHRLRPHWLPPLRGRCDAPWVWRSPPCSPDFPCHLSS